jgi:hypothetical protein
MNKNRLWYDCPAPPLHTIALTASLCVCALIASAEATTTAVDAPEIVIRGYQSFQVNGPKDAVTTWTRGGVLEDTEAAAQAVSDLEHLVELFGVIRTFHIMESIELSAFSRLVYAESAHQEGPIYIRFHLFLRASGWVVIDMHVDAVPEKVFPAWILEPKPLPDAEEPAKKKRRKPRSR